MRSSTPPKRRPKAEHVLDHGTGGARACFACHAQVKASDYVFSKPQP